MLNLEKFQLILECPKQIRLINKSNFALSQLTLLKRTIVVCFVHAFLFSPQLANR